MQGSFHNSNMAGSDHQDDQPTSPHNHQTLPHPNNYVESESLDSNTGKNTNSDLPRHKIMAVVNNSGHEPVLTPATLNGVPTPVVSNGDAAPIIVSSQEKPELTFSTIRIWLSASFIMAIYIFVFVSMGPLTVQYFVSRFAEDLHYNISSANNKHPCTNSTSAGDASMDKAQREASSTLMYATIASSIPAFITCLFAGSITDFIGRKFLIICCLSGAIIKGVILCLIIELQLDVQLIYLGSIVDGIGGSLFTTTLAMSAIISDITSKGENKAFVFAIIEGVLLVCAALAQMTVGYLINGAGFFVPALICVCLLCASLLVTIFILPETLKKKQDFTWNVMTHIKKTFGFYFSQGSTKNRRYQFIIGLSIHLTIMFVNLGKSSIETMYVLNRPFCWSSVDIGIFGAVRTVVMSLAAVFLLKVLKNRLSLEVIGMICGISSVAGFIVEGLAVSTLMMYLSSVAGILFTTAIPLPRAIMSQIASPTEQGALFSSMSCMEAVATLVSSTVSTQIYNATLDTFRGAVFMLMASLCLLSIFLFGIFRSLRLSNPNTYEHMIDDSVNTTTDYQSIGSKTDNDGNFSNL